MAALPDLLRTAPDRIIEEVAQGVGQNSFVSWVPVLAQCNFDEVATVSMALRHLEAGYARFFKRLGRKLRFKSRRNPQSATFMKTAFRYCDGYPTLALMREPLAIGWSRSLPSAPSSVTISCDAAGRWYVAFRVEVDPVAPSEPLRTALGIDLGLMTLAVSPDCASVANPRWLRQRRHRLRRAQRAFAREQKGSKNREKTRRAAARLHMRVSDARRDHHHNLTTQ